MWAQIIFWLSTELTALPWNFPSPESKRPWQLDVLDNIDDEDTNRQL
jgi:hypothetical protein